MGTDVKNDWHVFVRYFFVVLDQLAWFDTAGQIRHGKVREHQLAQMALEDLLTADSKRIEHPVLEHHLFRGVWFFGCIFPIGIVVALDVTGNGFDVRTCRTVVGDVFGLSQFGDEFVG